MKKLSLLLGVLLIAILAACGGNNEGAESSDGPTENQEESNDNQSEKSAEVSDTVLDNGDYVYEIKGTEQITGKYDDKQILALEISFTNNTDEPTSPWMATAIFAEQETDVTVEMLNGANGLFPEDYKPELVEMGDTDIKPGATVDAVIGYELLYLGEPVRLYDAMAMDEEDIKFERIVETTE